MKSTIDRKKDNSIKLTITIPWKEIEDAYEQTLNTHYAQLLGVRDPWVISSVDLDTTRQILTIDVLEKNHASFSCLECKKQCPLYDHREKRTWRHLDTMQFTTLIRASLPRIQCDTHGIKTVSVPWAEPGSRFTLLFERFAIDVLKAATSITKARQILKLSWDQIQLVKEHAVVRGLARRKEEAVPYVGLDEKSFLKGHHYATIASDIKKGCVLDVIEHRTQEATETLLKQALSEGQREHVQAVSVDMWPAFKNAVQSVIGHEVPIVHDKFHVSKYLNNAVDQVRRSEHKHLLKDGDESLTKTKYLFLKTPDAWKKEEKKRFKALLAQEFEVGKAWSLKEMFRHFWEYKREWCAARFFDKWYTQVEETKLKPLIKAAKTLKNHLEGLLTYCEHKITNAVAEGLNAVVQTIKANARGFRSFEHYRIAILFQCGKLEMYP